MDLDPTSRNLRAAQLLGPRYTKEQEERGFISFDFPCELGYWCPVCRIGWDETLAWSEYASFLWCQTCNFDWPSAMCVPIDVEPDPARPWKNAGREAAVKVFLDTIENAIELAKKESAA